MIHLQEILQAEKHNKTAINKVMVCLCKIDVHYYFLFKKKSVGPVVACSPADREVRGLNPTLA